MSDEQAARYETDAEEADELEFGRGRPVEVEAGPRRMSAFALRFDPAVVERLRERAAAEGVGVTQLVRAWVLERLEADDTVPVEADEALSTLRRLLARH
jgi:predicted HicB family RNase H-like nuclease